MADAPQPGPDGGITNVQVTRTCLPDAAIPPGVPDDDGKRPTRAMLDAVLGPPLDPGDDDFDPDAFGIVGDFPDDDLPDHDVPMRWRRLVGDLGRFLESIGCPEDAAPFKAAAADTSTTEEKLLKDVLDDLAAFSRCWPAHLPTEQQRQLGQAERAAIVSVMYYQQRLCEQREIDAELAAFVEQRRKSLPQEAGSKRAVKGKRIDGRMMKVLAARLDSLEWNSVQWAEELGCDDTTVRETNAWRVVIPGLRNMRARAGADQMDQSNTTPRGRRTEKPAERK
jgi:hypothetical protein